MKKLIFLIVLGGSAFYQIWLDKAHLKTKIAKFETKTWGASRKNIPPPPNPDNL